jgi:hypothetical protein
MTVTPGRPSSPHGGTERHDPSYRSGERDLAMDNAFWIDDESDRETASDGVSRYGAYVRDRIPGGFDECWDGTFDTRLAERFAALAWRTATGPVMSPPYVGRHPAVLSANVEANVEADDSTDLSVIAAVELAAPWPAALGRCREARRWRSWSYENRLGTAYPRPPFDDDIARGDCYALGSLRLVFPVPSCNLPSVPQPPHRHGQVEQAARRAVAVLAAELSRVVDPVLAALERS